MRREENTEGEQENSKRGGYLSEYTTFASLKQTFVSKIITIVERCNYCIVANKTDWR